MRFFTRGVGTDNLNRLEVVNYAGDAIAHLIRVSAPLRVLPHLLSPNRHVARAMSLYVGAAVHEPRYLVLRKRISVFPGE